MLLISLVSVCKPLNLFSNVPSFTKALPFFRSHLISSLVIRFILDVSQCGALQSGAAVLEDMGGTKKIHKEITHLLSSDAI